MTLPSPGLGRLVLGHRATTAPTQEEAAMTAVIRQTLMPMLQAEPQMIEFRTLARTVLATITGLPRVPRWRGRHRLDGITVDLDPDGTGVLVDALGTRLRYSDDEAGQADERTLGQLEALLLAGLAAVAAVRDPGSIDPLLRTSDEATPGLPSGSQTVTPDCATTPSAVTLNIEEDHADPGQPTGAR